MKKKSNLWIMLIVALVLGVATFYLTQTYLENKEKEIQSAYKPNVANTKKVIVAIGKINKGDVLKGPMVAPVEYPAEFVSEGAITPSNATSYFGQVMQVPLARGQIVYRSNLGGNAVDRFSDLLKEGGTAVTLEVDAKKSNSHMLIPGDYVDILVLAQKSKIEPASLLDIKQGKIQANTKMLVPLLTKIKVLSVDRNPLVAEEEEYRIPRDKQGGIITYSYVTVGVPLNDATKLALAQDLGEIVFFLRNAKDKMRVKVRTLDGLFAIYDENEKPKRTYEYYSARTRSVVPIDNEGDVSTDLAKIISSPGLIFNKQYPVIEDKMKRK